MRATNQAKTRHFRWGRLKLQSSRPLRAKCLAEGKEIVELACAVLAEDADAGGTAFLGDNMPRPQHATVPDRAARLAAYRYATDYQAARLGPVRSVAAILSASATHLFDGFAPRSQLLGPLAGALVAEKGLGPVIGHVIHGSSGLANRGQEEVFGAHRTKGVGPVERRLGIANLAGDSLVPISSHALVTDTRDDPATAESDRAAEAIRAARRWGFPKYPSSVAGHVEMQLEILTAARDIVAQRGKSSLALYNAKVDAAELLAVGFSAWVLADRIEYGPRESQKVLTGTAYYPGLDPEILHAIHDRDYRAMCRAADTLTKRNPDQVDATNFETPGHSMRGEEIVSALLEFDTTVPGFTVLDNDELAQVAKEAARMGIVLPDGLHAGVLPKGLRLLGGGKPATSARAIVIVINDQAIVFTTNINVDGPLRIEGIARAAMMMHSILEPTWMNCIKRFHTENNIYGESASTYHKRNALRLLKILGNLITVAAARGALD